MSFPKQPSSLHVLSSLMFVASFYASQVNNDNVQQGPKIVFDDKDIHSSSGVAKKR